MSTTTYVFVEKYERYWHFSDEKSALSVAMSLITSFHLEYCGNIKIEQILNSYPLTILTGKLFGFLKTLARHCCTASAIWDSWSYPAW